MQTHWVPCKPKWKFAVTYSLKLFYKNSSLMPFSWFWVQVTAQCLCIELSTKSTDFSWFPHSVPYSKKNLPPLLFIKDMTLLDTNTYIYKEHIIYKQFYFVFSINILHINIYQYIYIYFFLLCFFLYLISWLPISTVLKIQYC